MAVQARHYFSHDLAPAAAAGGSLFLDECAGCVPAPARVGDATTVLSDFPRSELAWPCNDDDDYGFLPRKRPRLELEAGQAAAAAAPTPGVGGLLEDQCAGTSMPRHQAGTERLLPVPRFLGSGSGSGSGSGAASTSGRMVPNGELLSSSSSWSWTHRHGVEVDALVRLEVERMRLALEEARRGHARALLAAVARAASVRLRASETGLERALRRNAELEEKARQLAAECQAWMGVARTHEAVAAGLRATLGHQLLLEQSPPCGGAAGADAGGGEDAEDAQSCCFEEAPAATDNRSRSAGLPSCKACGGGEACVVVLPCRHLCLCRACEAAVDACPVCGAARNGSLHVLFS